MQFYVQEMCGATSWKGGELRERERGSGVGGGEVVFYDSRLDKISSLAVVERWRECIVFLLSAVSP